MFRRSSSSPLTALESWFRSRRTCRLFAQMRQYVLFVGHPRSGTSLLGSLLNSHRKALVSNELHVLRYVRRGYSREQILWLQLQADRDFARLGRQWSGYDYSIPQLWQGRAECLEVVGDKKAARTAEILGADPGLLKKLRRLMGVPVKLIHVVRHPLDVLATVHLRRPGITLEAARRAFFARSETVERLFLESPESLYTLWQEDLIRQPRQTLAQLSDFCGLDRDEEFLEQCAAKIYSRPHESRHKVAWPAGLQDKVLEQSARSPFLERYASSATVSC